MESLRRNKLQPNLDLEIIVVSSTEQSTTTPDFVDIQINVPHSTIAPVAFNDGFKNARADSEWFMILNDDTCLTEDAIIRLVEATKERKMILNPFCNTDMGWLYEKDIVLDNGKHTKLMPRFTKIEEMAGFEESMMTYKNFDAGLVKTPFNCFHATLIPARLWKFIGGLDEKYISGPDDRDFCMQARRLGVESYLAMGTHIWHFGGTSVAKNPNVDENRKRNAEYFKQKWGIDQ